MTSQIAIGDGKTAAEALGELLTRYRVERKLSRNEVGDRVGTTSSRVDDFEKGKNVPDPRTWARYCNMVAKGLRGYVDVWKAAVAERSTPAKANDAALSAASFTASEPVDTEAIMTVHADPLPQVLAAKTFSAALATARMLAGVTQQELAEIVGVSSGAVANWETDRACPVAGNMHKLIQLMPELERWRDIARERDAPSGFTHEMRANTVTVVSPLPPPPPISAPLRANLGDMLSIALANTDAIASLPHPSRMRHDAYYTEVGGSRPEIATTTMERLADGDDDDVEVPDAPMPVLAIVPPSQAEPTYEELLERQRVAAIARLNAVRDAAKAKKALAAAQQEVARVQRIQAEAEAAAFEANEAVERYVSAAEDDAGA